MFNLEGPTEIQYLFYQRVLVKMDGKKKTRLHTDNNHIKHMHHKNIKDKKHRTSMDQALKRIVANNGPH